MKKFMVLFMANTAEFENAMKNATPEQQKNGMEAWMQWMNSHKSDVVDMGAPLGKTKRVDAKSTSDVKNAVGGYTIVQAQTHDAAAQMFDKNHPHLAWMPGAWIEVMEIAQIPGM